ncbi:hypothetical protein E4U42_007007, partial [Claviceps africana]
MDSAQRQLHVQIPQPTSTLNPLDPRLASTTCCFTRGSLPSSPGSAFDFAWVPDPPGSRSPTATRPPRTSKCSSTCSSGYRYSFTPGQPSAARPDAAAGPEPCRPDTCTGSPSSSLTSPAHHIAVPPPPPPPSLRVPLTVDTAVRPSAWLATSSHSSPTGAYSLSPASS